MSARRRVSPELVPQIGNLVEVRAAVAAVLSGFRSAREISAHIGVTDRRAGYALKAAEALGWVSSKDGETFVTDKGKELIATAEGSSEQRALFRSAFERSALVTLAPGLLAKDAPDRAEVAQQVRLSTGLSSATAESRAGALLRWRSQILEQGETSPRSPRSKPRARPPLFLPGLQLSDALTRDLHRDNPWWLGGATKPLPRMRRSFVATIRRQFAMKLAPVIVVRGPRQVGKTTAQLQVIEDLLHEGVDPRRILRVQFDELPALVGLEEPILRIADWFQTAVLGQSFNSAAKQGSPAYLFLDEVQNLPDWSVQLKHLVDGSALQALVTGSSALRIEAGRDSLAGRIQTLEVGTLTLREIASIRGFGSLPSALPNNGLDAMSRREFWEELRELGIANRELRDQTFAVFSERGGYPLVHDRASAPWPEIAQQLNETVIRRVIQHDLRVGDRGRKRSSLLLEELFRLACRYAGQSPGVDLFVREARRALQGDVGAQKVHQYLDFLDRTLLLRLVRPLELRLKKKRGSSKLCLADHGLRKSWLQEDVPLAPDALASMPHLSDLAGRIAESVCGGYLLTLSGIELAHFPERKPEPEVDFILTSGALRIPIEVKYRKHIDAHADTEGLRSFLEKTVYNAPFGILVTQTDGQDVPDPRIVTIPLSTLLMIR